MDKIKTVIVDASEAHRKKLEYLVKTNPSLCLENSFSNAIQLKSSNTEQLADFLIIDLELPLISGFELIESFQHEPQIVVTCKHDQLALKAFDYNITDYLMKPISRSRFQKAVGKVKKNLFMQSQATNDSYLFVKSNLRQVKIGFNEIKWVEALGDYIKLITQNGTHVVLSSLKAFEKQLPQNKFLRIHKSYIINLERVENLDHSVVEIDGKKMPISRKRRPGLLSALGV